MEDGKRVFTAKTRRARRKKKTRLTTETTKGAENVGKDFTTKGVGRKKEGRFFDRINRIYRMNLRKEMAP
jgi:hypothetical protein